MASKVLGSRLLAVVVCVALGGYSASSPFIMKNITTMSSVGPRTYALYDGQVFVTSHSLPASVQYQVLSTITVGTVSYGLSDKAVSQMVAKARKIGANTIIDEKTWR